MALLCPLFRQTQLGISNNSGEFTNENGAPGAISFSWWPHNSNFTMVYDTQITIVMGFLLTNKHTWGSDISHFEGLSDVELSVGSWEANDGEVSPMAPLLSAWNSCCQLIGCWLWPQIFVGWFNQFNPKFLCQFPCFMRIVCMQWHAMSLRFVASMIPNGGSKPPWNPSRAFPGRGRLGWLALSRSPLLAQVCARHLSWWGNPREAVAGCLLKGPHVQWPLQSYMSFSYWLVD